MVGIDSSKSTGFALKIDEEPLEYSSFVIRIFSAHTKGSRKCINKGRIKMKLQMEHHIDIRVEFEV